ncbi:MAG: SWIM zinc finger family protein [Propioniciclava sp.]|uniref:SWIM zinc finger family protein n=1 Tax=Propioniciclava sp. TaxID=2038686 RepID=UPI0039E4D548
MRWSRDQVMAVAPDPSSVNAAQKLARPGPWSETGANDALVWGQCQGSGKNPYQVSIDLATPAYRCTCPSRKFPCKHALALLLLWADGHVDSAETLAAFAQGWVDQRASRAEASARRAATREDTPADPQAQEKRAASRVAKMDAGVDDLCTWLEDVARGGAAAARSQPYAFWDRAAARLVDAQLPGLAERVRAVGSDALARTDWEDQLIGSLGRLWLLAQAWRGRDALTDDQQADLRAAVGWATPSEQVRSGRTRAASWLVMGAHRSEAGPLHQQRTWLRADDGEWALVLDTAGPGQALAVPQLAGSLVSATLAFYPGAAPQRALFAEPPVPVGAAGLGASGGIARALAQIAGEVGRTPWRERHPVLLADVAWQRDPALVVDAAGDAVPLDPATDLARLFALTGGRAAAVFGEWEAGFLRILTLELAEPSGERTVVPL